MRIGSITLLYELKLKILFLLLWWPETPLSSDSMDTSAPANNLDCTCDANSNQSVATKPLATLKEIKPEPIFIKMTIITDNETALDEPKPVRKKV